MSDVIPWEQRYSELAALATPGLWAPFGVSVRHRTRQGLHEPIAAFSYAPHFEDAEANAALIVMLRNDGEALAALVAAARRLADECDANGHLAWHRTHPNDTAECLTCEVRAALARVDGKEGGLA